MADWTYFQIWGDVTELSDEDLAVGLAHWQSQLDSSPGGHVFAEHVSRYRREMRKRHLESSQERHLDRMESEIGALRDEIASLDDRHGEGLAETLESLEKLKQRLHIDE